MKAYLLETEANAGVSADTLKELGVLYYAMDMSSYEEKLEGIRRERGYKNHDLIKLTTETPELDKKLEMFFREHYHEDEEIRFILEGNGYFDVRSDKDEWIRIEVTKGDLIIIPAKMYHRFTLQADKYIEAMRLFTEEPKWEAIPRD